MKFIKKIIFFSTLVILLSVLYLTFIGLNTNKLNDLVKNKFLEFNPNYVLEINDLNLKLYPVKLKFNVSSKNVIIGAYNQKLKLKNISTDVSIKSYLKGTYPLKNIKVESDTIEVKKLLKIVRNFKDNFQLMLVTKLIKNGNSKIFVDINLDEKGKIKKNYLLKGVIKNLKISSLNNSSINTNLSFTANSNLINIYNADLSFQKLKFNSDDIKIVFKNNNFLNIEGNIKNDDLDINISDLENIFKFKFKNVENKKIRFSSNNKFNFDISPKLKIFDFELTSDLNFDEIIYNVNNELLKKAFEIKNNVKIINQNLNIKLKGNKTNNILSKLEIESSGSYLIENKIDKFNFNISKDKDIYLINSDIEIVKNALLLDIFNYKKKKRQRCNFKFRSINK